MSSCVAKEKTMDSSDASNSTDASYYQRPFLF